MFDPSRRIIGFNRKRSALLLHFEEVNQDAVNTQIDYDLYVPPGIDVWGYSENRLIDDSSYAHPVGWEISQQPYHSRNLYLGNGGLFGSNALTAYDEPKSRVYWPHHDVFNFKDEDFTVDFWWKAAALGDGVNFTSPSAEFSVYFQFYDLQYLEIELRDPVLRNFPYYTPPFYAVKDAEQVNYIRVSHGDKRGFIDGSGIPIPVYGDSSTPLMGGTWYHVAYVRKGGVSRLFVNGALNAEWSASTYLYKSVATYTNWLQTKVNAHYIYLAPARINAPGHEHVNTLWFEEFHIQREAVFWEPFTPPAEPYGG